MINEVKNILVRYHLKEVSEWDILAWANSVNDNELIDTNAINFLRHYDDTAPNQKNSIERALLSLIPNDNSETLSQLLLLEMVDRLKNGKISSKEFVNFIIQSVWTLESDSDEPCCKWLINIFNTYNGFGFDDLSAMPNDELVSEIEAFLVD